MTPLSEAMFGQLYTGKNSIEADEAVHILSNLILDGRIPTDEMDQYRELYRMERDTMSDVERHTALRVAFMVTMERMSDPSVRLTEC